MKQIEIMEYLLKVYFAKIMRGNLDPEIDLKQQLDTIDSMDLDLIHSKVENFAERAICIICIAEILIDQKNMKLYIDCALNLARKYISEESTKFINGVLTLLIPLYRAKQ